MNKNDGPDPAFVQQYLIFSLDISFFQSILFRYYFRRIVRKDKTMRILTAVFLTIIFCAISASSKDHVIGSNQSFFRRIKVKPRRMSYNSSFHDTLWEKRLKDWEKRNNAVPQGLPRATFQLNKQSPSRSFRSSHRSFRSSHRVRHVRRGRTHVRRRSRR